MAEISGSVGALYYSLAYLKSTGIAFDKTASPDQITDSGSGFTVANGFADGMEVTVYGSTSNDGDYTIVTRANGALTLGEAVLVQDEVAGDTVYVYTTRPGTQLAGFFNWTLDNGVDMLDITDFSDGGYRNFIIGLKDWTATAEKHYLTTDMIPDTKFGTLMWVRFFIRYDASPNVTNAYFYEGPCYVSGISTNTSVDATITQTITFKGVGPLQLQTQAVAW